MYPVSYTHLDVYKRQVYYRDKEISTMKEKELSKIRAKDFGFVFQQTHLVSNLTPVSYTHLDVYKRQI